MAALDISVVICAYTEERWQHLVLAVESVQRQEVLLKEIIVVIDYNKHLLERVRTNIAGITVIENRETKGLSGARNSGIAQSGGAFVAFLDDDAIAEPDWLLKLSACFMDNDVIGVGGTVKPLWEEKKPRWFPDEFYWVVGCSYQSLPEHAVVVRNLYGGCMCIRREVFETFGGFKSSIGRVGTRPLGGEETELCIRVKLQWFNKKFIYEPNATIHHHISSQRATWHYFLSRCYAEGLSKAIITRHVGVRDSLSSERVYTLKTLPLGIARGIADCFVQRDLTGLQRAGAILAGLVTTTTGYVLGALSRPVAAENEMSVVTIKQVVRV